MRILALVKRVPATGGRINLTADGRSIDTAYLGFVVSPHEECAVEEGIRLVETHGGEVVVMTLGPGEAADQLRDALAVGAVRAVHLETDGADWDPVATAAALVERIRALEGEGGPFDLILAGNESADSGGYQVGIRVAHALGRPCVTGLKGIAIQDGAARCEQEVPGGRDVYRVPLPAVVTVKEGLNLPRYPSVPGRMRAKQKPVGASSPARPGQQLAKARLVVPEGEAKQAEILGHGPEAAPRVVEVLERLGVA